jgi:hypothetical protein
MEASGVVDAGEPPRDVAGQAAWWCLNQRQSLRYRNDGVPLHSRDLTLKWAEGREKLPQGFARRCEELRAGLKKEIPGAADKDWAEFELMIRSESPQEAMTKITKARDWAYFKLEKAAKANDKKGEKFYGDLLGKMEAILHDAILRAKRLGIDSGELLPRPEVERILWALAFWLLRSADQHQDALTTKLTALSPGLAAGPVRAILDPELLSTRFLTPFAYAAKLQSGVGLPAWVVAKMREAAGDFLEGGEKQFDESAQ